MEKLIPKIREREGNEKNPFSKFGNGKGMKKSILKVRERESEASILGNDREREFPLTPEKKTLGKLRKKKNRHSLHPPHTRFLFFGNWCHMVLLFYLRLAQLNVSLVNEMIYFRVEDESKLKTFSPVIDLKE